MVPATRERRLRAGVFVLGDIGRSPRMQYHAAMLLRMGAEVEVIALRGREPLEELAAAKMTLLPSLDSWTSSRWSALAPLGAAARALVHFVLTYRALRRSGVEVLVVQTPPALPSLAVMALLRKRLRIVVDWHNVTSDVARPRVGRVIASLIASVERRLGRRFEAHLAVSDALRERLASWQIKANTFRDAPWSTSEPDREHGRALLAEAGVTSWPVAITATSWSRDEDFGLLLDALKLVDPQLANEERLSIVITGEGPGRPAFLSTAYRARLQRVTIVSSWFAHRDFFDVLSAADLAISLHKSVSGVDLPMKLFDFESAGLPAAVLDYGPVLREIDGTGWKMFRDAETLASLLLALVRGGLARAVPRAHRSWSAQWNAVVAPVVEATP